MTQAGERVHGPDLHEQTGTTGHLNRMMLRTMDGVVLFDEVGRILWANAAFGRMVGQSPLALAGRSLLSLTRESERSMVLGRWRQALPGQEISYRMYLCPPDGQQRLVMVSQAKTSLEGGPYCAYVRDLSQADHLSRQFYELQGLTAIARAFASITDPRQMLDRLVSELAELMGVEMCAICLHDPISDLVEPQTPAFGIAEADLGWLRERLAESGHLLAVAQEGQPRISNDPEGDPLLRPALVTGLGARSLLTAPLTSGQRILGFVHVLNRLGGDFHQDDAQPLQIFATQVAVALDKAQVLRELAREKDLAVARAGQLQALVDSMADGVAIFAADGRLVHINGAGQALTGLSAAVIGDRADRLMPSLNSRRPDGRSIQWGDGPVARALRGETVRQMEVLVRPIGGADDLALSCSAAPVLRADGAISLVVLVVRDMTELRALQRHKDDFLAVASHELRTPLTLLRGHAQYVLRALERGNADPAQLASNLRQVIGQVDRLTRLTHDLADVSRVNAGQLRIHPAPCNLAALVHEVVERFRIGSAAQRHELSVRTPGEPVIGEWDVMRLEQVLTNLLDNAIKYAPGGGQINVDLRADEQMVALAVRDEGPGIPAEKLPHLFKPFYRGQSDPDRHGRGLGLGLHIVYEIARLHGGTVTVESAPGAGSCFRVTLPRRREAGLAAD